MIHVQYLSNGGTDWSSKSWTSGTAVYSDPINLDFMDFGVTAFLLFADAASSIDVDVTQEYSHNGRDWYTPNTVSSDSLTDISAIKTAIVADDFVALTVYPTKFMRFKIDPDHSGTLSILFGYSHY